MPLINVRLAPEDARLAQDLRARGVSISDVVRRAIRTEAHKARAAESKDVPGLIREMLAAHPTPSGASASRQLAGADRRKIRRIIRAKLRRS